jgi:hypothetical protein
MACNWLSDCSDLVKLVHDEIRKSKLTYHPIVYGLWRNIYDLTGDTLNHNPDAALILQSSFRIYGI